MWSIACSRSTCFRKRRTWKPCSRPGGGDRICIDVGKIGTYRRSRSDFSSPAMPKEEKTARAKVTILSGKGVSQTINYLLEDRDELEWLVAVGRNKSGEIF